MSLLLLCWCCRAAGEVKAELIALLTDIVGRHQQARTRVTEDIVDAFMAVRPMHSAMKR
jgi:hypothetical protein